MEHSHKYTYRLVSDCDACDQIKAARNQAIAHLHEALHLLSLINRDQSQPTIRLNLAPIGLTGDDAPHCHSVDLTAKHAEALSDAVDSMNGHASSEAAIDQSLRDLADGIEAAIPIDEDRMARSTARFMGWLQGQSGEAVRPGEWTAAAVAQNNPDLWDEINDAFFEFDLRAITKDVLNETQLDNLTVNRALDSWFGDIPDPELTALYADDDEGGE